MKDMEMLLNQAEILAVERWPGSCFGCGFENSCSTHGCAVINKLVETVRENTDRLAAYEDIGMDPEDIKETKALAQIDLSGVGNLITEAIDLLLETENQGKGNAPLTLEEMREIECEPVWIERFDGGKDGWAIYGDMQSIYGVYFQVPAGGMRLPYDGYRTEWLAYRRKPEGGKSNA